MKMNEADFQRLAINLSIAFKAILQNKLRSILTALGIVFGVGAVISMLAIGNGARQDLLEQSRIVGSNNIIVEPVNEKNESLVNDDLNLKGRANNSPGLQLRDIKNMKQIISSIDKVSPEIIIETYVLRKGLRRTAKLIGITPVYFEISDFTLDKGRMFSDKHLTNGESVCIIGKSIEDKFFATEDPCGKYIKCGSKWLKIIGVLNKKTISEKQIADLGIRDFNLDVYAPLNTVLRRYRNSALVTKANIQTRSDSDEEETEKKAIVHQIDRFVIQVKETDQIESTVDVLSRMLKRHHNNVVDYEISVPIHLIKQKQKTKDIFNIVLGAIAGISLLVGGIGIMNIMLASVMERIKEIGIRLSIGATKKDIITQFLLEAVIISVLGGALGVIMGISISFLIGHFAQISTIVSLGSVVASFVIASAIGLIFGIAPAKKAAEMDPIISLRHE